MVRRAQFGLRNGVYGAWVSKPGIDVTSAVPGQFLLDTSSQVFQSVFKGDSLVAVEAKAVIPQGTVRSLSVPLPGLLANFSNLMMHATYYLLNNSGQYFAAPNISTTFMTYRVNAGVLILSINWQFSGGTGTDNLTFYHHAAYTVFRGQF